MKTAMKLLWLDVATEVLALALWAVLVALAWTISQSALIERLSALAARPQDIAAWVTLLVVFSASIYVALNLSSISQSLVGGALAPLRRKLASQLGRRAD